MKYADSITKNFLSYGQPRITPPGGAILEWQDPTYLGFQWRIIDTRDYSGQTDLDYYPQGLFLPDNDPDSAVSYFARTNQRARAEMIQEFKKGFITLLKEAPWYFTKVTGLADIWKISPGNSFRGKEKKITIETEEAIDLKITYLMDLYRKAVFDPGWMRYALPENQRMFAMELVVAEVRPMQTSLHSWIDLNAGSSDPGIILSDVGGLFRAAGNLANDVAEGETGIGSVLKSSALSAAAGKSGLRAPWSTTTFLSFRFDLCTFDVFGSSPNYLENVGKTASDKATNNIVINTPYISEVNSYGLLGAVLKESYYAADYLYTIKDLNQQPRTISDTLGGKSFTSTVEPALRSLTDRVASSLGLENVYGFSVSTLANSIQGFANNPIGTAGNILRNFAAQGGVTLEQLGNIGLTGDDIKLIAEFLGNALPSLGPSGLVVGDMGKAVEDEVINNPNLVRGSIGKAVEDQVINNPNLVRGSIGKTVEDDQLNNPSLIVGNLPKGILSGPTIVKARLGNVYKQ